MKGNTFFKKKSYYLQIYFSTENQGIKINFNYFNFPQDM